MPDEKPISPRIPPNSHEAELAVLSAMLFDREAIATAVEVINGDDFYRPGYQAIFDSMFELFSRSVPVDAVTLTDKLQEKGILEQVGGHDEIIKISSAFFTSANVKHHAQIVWEKSLLRKLIKASASITNASFEAKEEAAAILDMAEKSIFAISQGASSRDFTHIEDVLLLTMNRLEELYNAGGKITGIETGFIDLDKMTAGLQPSDLIYVGARPSMGKTAFLLNVAQHAAVRRAVPTAFFSLEMSKEQLGNRLLSAESGVDSGRLRTGALLDEDWEMVSAGMGSLSNAPLFIDDTPAMTPSEMRAKCRRLKIEMNLGLVIVDYLQYMALPTSSRPESRHLEIAEISRSLKALAKELNVPVVVAAQLSRAVESRKDHRPMLSDLRESGGIEQDADVVAFLYRDEYYFPETLKKGQAEVIIAKQRNGPIGKVDLMFLGNLTRFVNMETQLRS